MDIIKAMLSLSVQTQESIDSLVDMLIKENEKENISRGYYARYDQYWAQLEKGLRNETEELLWKSYQNLRRDEDSVFNPYKAYVAGREAKMDGKMEKVAAYESYLEEITESDRYIQIMKILDSIFEDLRLSLPTEHLRHILYEIDKLYKQMFSPFEKYLWVFFYMGYDRRFD